MNEESWKLVEKPPLNLPLKGETLGEDLGEALGWRLGVSFLFIALEHLLDVALLEFRAEEAGNPNYREASYHSEGTAVNRVDGVAHEHVDDSNAHTPGEAGPYRGRGDAAPVETQHEGSEEGSGQGTP